MRSYLRKITMVAALAAPLAALAADTSATSTKPADDSNPCGMPCCGPTGQRARGPQAPTGDRLSELGGQNGTPNSFDSP